MFFPRRYAAFELFEPVLNDDEFGDRDVILALFDHEESFAGWIDVVVPKGISEFGYILILE